MNEQITNYILIYLAVINLVSAITVAHDKAISRLPRGSVRRVPEKVFVLLSALGGGILTLLSFLMIRHKTKSHGTLLLKVSFFAAIWTGLIICFLL